jgi:hypothetical protein
VPLLTSLRRHNKTTVVISRSDAMSLLLDAACDHCHILEYESKKSLFFRCLAIQLAFEQADIVMGSRVQELMIRVDARIGKGIIKLMNNRADIAAVVSESFTKKNIKWLRFVDGGIPAMPQEDKNVVLNMRLNKTATKYELRKDDLPRGIFAEPAKFGLTVSGYFTAAKAGEKVNAPPFAGQLASKAGWDTASVVCVIAMLRQFELAQPDAVAACSSAVHFRGLVDRKVVGVVGTLPQMFGEDTFAEFLYGTADVDEDVLVFFREEQEPSAATAQEDDKGLMSRWFGGSS